MASFSVYTDNTYNDKDGCICERTWHNSEPLSGLINVTIPTNTQYVDSKGSFERIYHMVMTYAVIVEKCIPVIALIQLKCSPTTVSCTSGG